ncbi:DEAD/DEAH box helicase [Lactobacillus crispatus]|uniref:DEAD/DEAH box helicase n=2 Tax=Lactobacillus crispatus TaxID=47770 RepID=UPI0022AC2829|nr:DEAD/DEAH box helicase [Lactobacillus crispatus]MCZ3845767.1 DEAD/DEAH box helicase [Lactobacillus crispatus]MCZ3848069.1 DEAD/DEAH box helicase [Lactobacillus crispatus]MCZ3854006.1 DEAD/DEAH box helicase [Lactobacillus crispatus]MCZ3856250.1 DEAD/DEAH box helicase [Lactobacillus crispatus]MCZ3858546.1 DEAD/DEAH box helicase [Lactobacillus crispatus]
MFQLFDYQQDLVDKARNALAAGNQGVLIVSPPGSGKSVVISEIAKLTVKKGGHVLFFVHRQELVKQIKDSFKQQGVDLNHCTILTVGKVANRLNILAKPDLIIVDESQHSRAKTYQKIFNYYSDVPRLGFTGSPWRLSGKGFKDIYSAMIEGPTTKWLIEHHKLAPFTVYGYQLGDKNLLKKSSTGDYTSKSMDDFTKSIIHGDIVKSWLKFAKDRKTIIYCHSTSFSKIVAQEFRNAGINALHADAKTPSNERNKIMDSFKQGQIKILCNVDLVSEGFNVPDCSCVVLLRPTESLVVYLQQSMRAMRYQPNKHAIIIDQVGNFERFGLPDTDYKWTLEDREKHPRKDSGSTEGLQIKTCPDCFAVIKAECVKCPICGHDFSIEIRKIKQKKDQELRAIKAEKFHIDLIAKKKVSELTSFKELTMYAKAKHYKNGWAWHMAKRKGFI